MNDETIYRQNAVPPEPKKRLRFKPEEVDWADVALLSALLLGLLCVVNVILNVTGLPYIAWLYFYVVFKYVAMAVVVFLVLFIAFALIASLCHRISRAFVRE